MRHALRATGKRISHRLVGIVQSKHAAAPILRLPPRQLFHEVKGRQNRLHGHHHSIAVESQPRNNGSLGDDPHAQVLKDFQELLLRPTWFPEAGILDILRKRYPEAVVTQTPYSTRLLDFAKAGHAVAVHHSNRPQYGYREYKIDTALSDRSGTVEDKFGFARINYSWRGRRFPVYLANFWTTSDYYVGAYYILVPRKADDFLDGRSLFADELISAASQHDRKVEEEIWVYDKGSWNRNKKLWKAVRSSTWDKVILSNELKKELLGDIQSFFDRREDYAAFAVPWKVS